MPAESTSSTTLSQQLQGVPPSLFEPACHPLVDKVTKEVDNYFLENWHFSGSKARKKFVAAGFSRVTCYYFPKALDDRIHFACRLLTVLFLIDDALEYMSFEEGSAYNERLIPISRGDELPDRTDPAQFIMYDLWESMRAHDREMANDILEPVFLFMRAQTDRTRAKPMSLGKYFQYREKDVGKALLSALMRFAMGLQMTPKELELAKSVEQNCSKHISVINDIYSYEKELLAANTAHPEGGVLCSSVQLLALETELSIQSAKRVLFAMCREWEVRHQALAAQLKIDPDHCSPELLTYVKGLEYQMSGNEIWSKTTKSPKRNRVSAGSEMSQLGYTGHGPKYRKHAHRYIEVQQSVVIPDARKNMDMIKHIPLSPFDNVIARFYGKLFLFLRLKPGQDIHAVHESLESGLSRTLQEIPFFAGKVFLIEPGAGDASIGRLEIRYPEHPRPECMPKLVFRDFTDEIDYEDLMDCGVPQDELDGEKFLPAAYVPDLAAGADVLVLQANYIDGGVLLGFGIYHAVTDGSGSTTFCKLWASNCAKLQESGQPSGRVLDLSPESFDYGALKRSAARATSRLPDTSEEMWRLLGLNPVDLDQDAFLPVAPSTSTSKRTVMTTIFYFTPKAFARLKEDCCQNTTRPVSANDALMALLWRVIMRARITAAGRSLNEKSETTLDTTFDARALFPGLPASYIGTVILISTARMPLDVLTAPSTPLALVATAVRAAADSITEERAHAALAAAEAVPDYTKVTYPFATFNGDEVCITSLLQLNFFEMNWGNAFANGGRIESVRPPRREFDALCRRCVVLPLRQNGGFEVLVSLLDEEMRLLEKDEEFSRYAMFLCH